MKVADAHCDTLTKFNDNPFHSPEAAWNVKKFKKAGGALQYFAIFTPPEYSGSDAAHFAANSVARFYDYRDERINLLKSGKDYDKNKINALLSLEGATPIINDIHNLTLFYKLGVRAMTLTWNHRNYLADGIENDYGLTEFGKKVVKKMNKIGMIVDVSHLNENGFDDVAETSDCAFIASHSNAYAVRAHKRNLKDRQIKEIIDRKGFIGLNFYANFISDLTIRSRDEELIDDFVKHVGHFLNLGAGDVLGLGADFDGMDRSPFKDVSEYGKVEELLRERLKLEDKLIEKIMFTNLRDFTLRSI